MYRENDIKDTGSHTIACLHIFHKVKFQNHLCHLYISQRYESPIIITLSKIDKISNITVNIRRSFAFNLALTLNAHFSFTVKIEPCQPINSVADKISQLQRNVAAEIALKTLRYSALW